MKKAASNSSCKINTQGTLQTIERQMQYCTICSQNVEERYFYSFGCTHYFCKYCLIDYVNSKLKQWSTIQCCQQQCGHVIDHSHSSIYHLLSEGAKKKVDQLLDNLDRMNNIRNCKKCQIGILIEKIGPQQKLILQCKECNQISCYNCFGIFHSGKCTNLQVLDYPPNCSQCRKCKSIIQKREGCSHIKCMCGYQFCFECSYHWSPSHLCEFKVTKRTGCSLYAYNFIKTIMLVPLFIFVLVISIFYVLVVCIISAFILGLTGWINACQSYFIKHKIQNNYQDNGVQHRRQRQLQIRQEQTCSQKICFFIAFIFWFILLPPSIPILAIIGFFVPLYNICFDKKIVFEPDILKEYVEQIRHCYDFYWII